MASDIPVYLMEIFLSPEEVTSEEIDEVTAWFALIGDKKLMSVILHSAEFGRWIKRNKVLIQAIQKSKVKP